jgi:hypothetical protein
VEERGEKVGKTDRNPLKSKDKLIYKEPPLTDSRWSEAIKFAVSKMAIEQINDSYYFNNDKEIKITFENIGKYKKFVDELKVKKFDDYSNIVKMVCRVTVNLEKYICTHVIGLATRLKLVVPPTHTINFAFNQKTKRGRKPTAKGGKALILD